MPSKDQACCTHLDLLVSGSEFRVPGFVFRASGSEFRVLNFELRVPSSGFRISHVGIRDSGLVFWVLGSRSWVSDSGCRLSVFEFQVSDGPVR